MVQNQTKKCPNGSGITRSPGLFFVALEGLVFYCCIISCMKFFQQLCRSLAVWGKCLLPGFPPGDTHKVVMLPRLSNYSN